MISSPMPVDVGGAPARPVAEPLERAAPDSRRSCSGRRPRPARARWGRRSSGNVPARSTRSRRPGAYRAPVRRPPGSRRRPCARRSVSPTRTSLRRTSSSLWSVARAIVEPGDGHRVELGERREHAGATDLHADLAQHRRLLLGRELVRDRPPRRLARVAELVLERERVDLDDHAVDLVRQVRRASRAQPRKTRGRHRGSAHAVTSGFTRKPASRSQASTSL